MNALQQNAPLEIIKWMCNTNYNVDAEFDEDVLDMLTMKTNSDSVVLHHAALYADLEIIQYIISLSPKSLGVVNLENKFPVDLAKEKNRGKEIVKALAIPLKQRLSLYMKGEL